MSTPPSPTTPTPLPSLNPLDQGIPFSRLLNQSTHTPFSDLIKCKICFNILNTPFDCNQCGNSFCYSCINTLHSNNKPCPFNCTSYSIQPSSFGITSYLSKLTFSCKNKSNGCNEVIAYSNISAHDKECKYFYTTCPNVKCGKRLQWTKLEHHMKNECDYTLFKCSHCSLELYRNEYYEHAVNCNNVMNSLEYVANKRNVSKEKEWNNIIKDLPELKETSFISLFKLLMHQINVNNEKINNRFDVITNELKEIHEDIDRVCKNNMIFFESINTELENINNKINSNNDININNETLTSLPLDGNADNTMRKFPTMTTSNNNSLLSEHNSSVGGSTNNNVTSISNSNSGKIKNNKHNKVKMLQIGKNGTSGIKRKSCSPRNNNNNNSNSSNNNSANKEKDKDGFCPPHSKPFNTFTGFTNSNLVCIIHNQETIISKLTKIEKNQESNKNEIVKEIKEKEENFLLELRKNFQNEEEDEKNANDIIEEENENEIDDDNNNNNSNCLVHNHSGSFNRKFNNYDVDDN